MSTQRAERGRGDAETQSTGDSEVIGPGLRTLGIVAPVGIVLALGLADIALEDLPWWDAASIMLRMVPFLALATATVIFALAMFRLIDHAQGRIVRQNRDLAAAHAVSTAIQGQQDRADIVRAAADALLGASGADQVRIALGASAESGAGVPDAVVSRAAVSTAPDPATVELPLANTSAEVGRLGLWYPDGTAADDRIGPSTLSTLSTQVAYAVQLSEAMGHLHRGRDEGFAFYDVLVKISNQAPTLSTLVTIADHARRLLGADAAAIVLNVATATSIRFDSDRGAPEACSDGTAVLGVGLPDHHDVETGERVNPIGCYHWAYEAKHEVLASTEAAGALWVGRHAGTPFSDRDRTFLATMAGLAGIAVTNAQSRETARQRAVLAERTRIARETHDSHAQVLGAVHLRLRALDFSRDLAGLDGVRTELSSLADVCEEAYADVREVIMGLRDAEASDRDLAETLCGYLEKYSQHYGIETAFSNEVAGALSLTPRSEAEITRVVQEALTNVRKHAHARRATVTVSGSDAATTFTIVDDGVGFDAPADAGTLEGYGLVTMRERVSALGGTLEIASAPGHGTRVVATVPEPPTRTDSVRKAG